MSDDMFAPPVNRAMKVLDRSFFQKTIPLSAARIFNTKDISRLRSELMKSGDALALNRLSPIRPDPSTDLASKGGKCILLRPEVHHNDPRTWSPKLQSLETAGTVGVIPFSLHLDYNDFTYSEIMNAVIPPPPEDVHDEIPTGFSQAGHVAHLNLRKQYLPYKHIIAEVLADKNPTVRTVINKLDTVGTENAYRTFAYEVLSGPDDMNVTLREQDCTFSFDFSRVYWNSRLHTEHERLCAIFREGDAICDVMAGVGPFAIPAGKKKAFVYANDLNPDSYASLVAGIKLNKVSDFVKPFNTDGAEFIKTATTELLTDKEYSVPVYQKQKFSRSNPQPPVLLRNITQPRIFSHYVMNLPASALTFLPSFVGLYSHIPGHPVEEIKKMFFPHTETRLPWVHVYCFSTKSEDNVAETKEICETISKMLGTEIKPESEGGAVTVHDVRDVAPKKRMFCASFRLPEEVVFRE
ncbi:guanine(37)-N1-methyltransferase [Sporormia fimetaria CBS 119925]|uniref:tRNA (guanine(37)-N1)-methyltransferase n=1 Tax=Sporormia fimetaria CBS 119925 TaxID=1340428 RepID=A0A6A6VKA3_9PLEO|nr:guanine(37)-N1-methyltransferase [Sporormia fimetaria CBS 119925]